MYASYDASAESCGLSVGSKHDLAAFRIGGIPEEIAAAARIDPAKTPRIRSASARVCVCMPFCVCVCVFCVCSFVIE